MIDTNEQYHNQVFLDPATRSSWRVIFNNRVCSPDFNDRGPALAYLDMLTNGIRKPEYAS